MAERYSDCGHEDEMMLPDGSFICDTCKTEYHYAHCVTCGTTRVEQHPGDLSTYQCPNCRKESTK